MGGGTSTNTVTQQAPQLVPQSVPGYNLASGYYQGLLSNPQQAVYPGQRVAPLAPGQEAAIGQAYSLFGGGPTSTDRSVQNYLDTSLQGGFLAGPQAQAAVSGLAQPLFQQFESNTLPGIRDRAELAGQGTSSTRRDVATNQAINQFGQGLATGAAAPIYQAGLQNMQASAQTAPSLTSTELAQLGGLQQAGGLQQQQLQQEINAAMQRFQDPYNIASQAANALFGASGVGGGAGTSQSRGFNDPGAMAIASEALGGASSVGTMALLAYTLWPLIFA